MKEKEYKLIIPNRKIYFKLLNIVKILNTYFIYDDCKKIYIDSFYDTKNFDFLKKKFYLRKRKSILSNNIILTIKELKNTKNNLHIRNSYTNTIPLFEYKYISIELKKLICSITNETNFSKYNLLFQIKQKRIFKYIKYRDLKEPIALLSFDTIIIYKGKIPNIFLELEIESIRCNDKELRKIFYSFL